MSHTNEMHFRFRRIIFLFVLSLASKSLFANDWPGLFIGPYRGNPPDLMNCYKGFQASFIGNGVSCPSPGHKALYEKLCEYKTHLLSLAHEFYYAMSDFYFEYESDLNLSKEIKDQIKKDKEAIKTRRLPRRDPFKWFQNLGNIARNNSFKGLNDLKLYDILKDNLITGERSKRDNGINFEQADSILKQLRKQDAVLDEIGKTLVAQSRPLGDYDIKKVYFDSAKTAKRISQEVEKAFATLSDFMNRLTSEVPLWSNPKEYEKCLDDLYNFCDSDRQKGRSNRFEIACTLYSKQKKCIKETPLSATPPLPCDARKEVKEKNNKGH